MARTMKRLLEMVDFEAPNRDAQNTQDGWKPGFTANAGYTRLRGGESVQDRRLQGTQPTIITVRNYSKTVEIGTDWRAVDKRTGEIFNIHAKTLTQDRTHFEILAESGVAT